ncbi:hypothetical protein PFISCL1PPCAC_22001, partial [Pristionchus fissidentatus]
SSFQSPLLGLPNEILLNILQYIPNGELSALRVNKRIDLLDPGKAELNNLEITTTAECSEFKCDRYSPPLIRSSMEGIIDRFRKLHAQIDTANEVKLTFVCPNPFHAELVQLIAPMQIKKLTVTCSCKDGQRHSSLSRLITDDFLDRLMTKKREVFFHFIVHRRCKKKLI